MEKSCVFMDSDSEEDEYSPNSQRINEIIEKARDVQRIQKPLLRELINPNIEDDIRKNYRRSIVRRAMQSNVVTSTPCASSARHSYLNISSILDLPTGGENDNKKNTVQNAHLSNIAQSEIKEKSAEEINNPDKQIEVLDVSGLQLIDNFKKPFPRTSNTNNSVQASTSALNKKKKTKPHDHRYTLRNTSKDEIIKRSYNNECSDKEKQMTDLKSVETSLLRKNDVHSNGSGVALEYKCSSQSKPGTSKQDIIQTETEDNNSIHEDIEYRKENVPYLSNSRHICLRSGENSRESNVEDDSTQETCRQKNRFHGESRKKITRESKKYTKQGKLPNRDSDSSIYQSHNKAKNKLRCKRNFNNFTEDSDGSDLSLIRLKENKSHKVSVKENNMRRTRKYHDRSDLSEYSSTEEIFVKKKKKDHAYIPYTYREKEKLSPEPNKEKNLKMSKKYKRHKSDFSADRSIQKNEIRYDNLNNVSSGSTSSTLYLRKSKKFKKVPLKVYKKSNLIGGASKYQYQSDVSMSSATETCKKRSRKKGDQNKLKHDKYSSKSKCNSNIIDKNEWKQCARNKKSNAFKKTESFSKRQHESLLSISTSSITEEYDQSCVLKDNSEVSSPEYKNNYLGNQKSRRKSYWHLKYPKEYRDKSIPKKIQKRSAKSSYYHENNSTDLEERENSDVTIMNNHGKYFRLPKRRKNELKIKPYIPNGKEYKKYKKPIKKIGNNILSNVKSTNDDINYLSSLPKKSLQVLVNSLVNKALQKHEPSSEYAPIERQKNNLVQRPTQERQPEFNFLCKTLFPSLGSYTEDDSFNFRDSRPPSILSNKELSPPQKISVKYFARKPFTKLDDDTLSSTIELREPDFYFFKKKTSVPNKIIKKKNKCDGLFERFRCSENQNVNCVPLTSRYDNWNYRKSISPFERIAIKAKLDEVLGIHKNDCNEEKIIIQEERKILESLPQFSTHSQTSLRNSEVHDSTNERHNPSLKINSVNKLSQMEVLKLSVGTQYSPFINDATEKDCLPVSSCSVSSDTPNMIQNTVEVERDAAHSGNITSSNKKKNMSTNTSLNTNQVINSNFIRSRTVLKFDEDMESNKNSDLNSPSIVELEMNRASEPECLHKDSESQTLKNDFLIDQDRFTNDETYTLSNQTKIELNHKTLKQGENISSTPNSGPTQLLLDSEIIDTEEKRKSLSISKKRQEKLEENYSQNGLPSNTDLKENGENLEDSFTNTGDHTSNDRRNIKVFQNITLKKGRNLSSSPNSGLTQPFVRLDRMNIVEEREALSESLTNSKSRLEKQKNSNIGLTSDTELKENVEKAEAVNVNNGNHTSNDQTAMEVSHNITPQQREKNSCTPGAGQRQPFVYLERMSIAEMSGDLSKSSKKSKKKLGKQKKAKIGLASATEHEENIEEPVVRKSSRNRRPPQFIWWKSSIAEKGVGLMEYYETHQPTKRTSKQNNQSEYEASPVVRNKGTSYKKGRLTKNNKKREISTKKALVSKNKRINVSTNSNSFDEKPSTSKATGEEITFPGDYSINNIPLLQRMKDNLSCSNTIPTSENSDDPGYVTSSTRKEKEIEFTKLCKNLHAADLAKNNEDDNVFVNVGQALSMENNFGYIVIKPEQSKRTVNLKYDMIYFIIEGTCVIRTDYEHSIKGPKELMTIKKGTPYQINNSGSQPLLMMFSCFP
ncbi:hypothetical protein WA026_018588 [Henosepilachna vigintioctopunctata]|uniref:Centromere protein C n=1 Tax=Henosepilachna vigintioctopunctata TaxID=420089 RepID=A0AAW1UA48_9CUCU